MKKKLVLILMGVLLCLAPNAIKALEPVLETLGTGSGAKEIFIANGNEITISERTDSNPGASITWATGSMNVGENTRIIGGLHNDDTKLAKTSIIMNGGTVYSVVGGGLHKSYVEETNVVINGGKIKDGVIGGGASSFVIDADTPSYYAGDPLLSPNVVINANVAINGGVMNTVFGGGEGISNTKRANVVISDGTINYVTAGGANGHTEEALVDIEGGKIQVLQSVNRGDINTANVNITGGEVVNAYIAGETDSSVTGEIKLANLHILGGSVTNVEAGYNKGSKEEAKDVVNLSYVDSAVENIDSTYIEKDNMLEKVIVTIDGVKYQLEKGDKLSENFIIEELTKKEGYKFIKFTDAAGKEYTLESTVDTSLELTTNFEKVAEETVTEVPNTIDSLSTYVIVLLGAIAAIVIGKKFVLKKLN